MRENGLVRENDTTPDVIKQLNDSLAQQINKQAGEIQHGGRMKPLTLQPASLRRSEPSWSPTELGEKILGFYAEAGAEDSTSTADASIAGDR